MNTKLVNAVIIDGKENTTEIINPNDIDCLSPAGHNLAMMLVVFFSMLFYYRI